MVGHNALTVAASYFPRSKGVAARYTEAKAGDKNMDEEKRAEYLASMASDDESLEPHLSQRLSAVGELAAGLAHDFNNMVAIIHGHCELILEQMEEDDPFREDIQSILSTAQKAGGLTTQLMDIGRGKVPNAEAIDMNAALKAIAPALQDVVEGKVRLSLVMAPDPGYVRINTTQLTQILMNLAWNARDAMPRGGELCIELDSVHNLNGDAPCREVGTQKGPFVRITVTDTGCGMDHDTLSRAFRPFFTTKRGDEGTGLGLSTVFQIVRQNGGHVCAESRPGLGTTFRIYLPRVLTECNVPPPPKVASPGR